MKELGKKDLQLGEGTGKEGFAARETRHQGFQNLAKSHPNLNLAKEVVSVVKRTLCVIPKLGL